MRFAIQREKMQINKRQTIAFNDAGMGLLGQRYGSIFDDEINTDNRG